MILVYKITMFNLILKFISSILKKYMIIKLLNFIYKQCS
jgi:hypothetical protein